MKIRLGIFGLRRGSHFFKAIRHECGEVVAVCEKDEWRIKEAKESYKCAGGTDEDMFTVYSDFDEFIKHDMDAVMLCNCFNEHTKYAIKCLEKGISVLSETQSNTTMAEGVELVRAAKKSKATYMLLENYPFMLFNLEIKKVYDQGTLGKAVYAEGEYNHPGPEGNVKSTVDLCPFENHWRRYLPRTYYLTHSLAPLMYITGARPKRVVALPVYEPSPKSYSMVGDIASAMMTLNEDNSVFRFFGHSSFGYEENSYRLCCQNGQIENRRGNEKEICLTYNEWQKPEDKEKINIYEAKWDEKDAEIAGKMGHMGGDFFVIRAFFDTLRGKRENPFDVYFATTLASVAILAHRSQLQGGMPYDIPDFRKEEDLLKWENDRTTPFYGEDGSKPNIPCCSNPAYRPTEDGLEWYKDALDTIKFGL